MTGILATEFSQCLVTTNVVDKESDCETINTFMELEEIGGHIMEQGSS